MLTVIAVCFVLTVIILGTVAVYLIQTLVQLKKTAASVETLSIKLNEEMDKVQSVTSVVVNVAQGFTEALKKSSFILNLIKGFIESRSKTKKK